MTLSRTVVAMALAILMVAAADEPKQAAAQASPATPDATQAAPSSSKAEAEAVIDAATAELLVVLSNESLTDDARLHAIEKIIHQRFDLEKMASLALDRKKRSRLSETQLAAYTCEFKPYLSRYIGSRFGRYEQEQVEIIGAKMHKKGIVKVKTRILGGRFDQGVVSFTMLEGTDDEWRAIDATFEGVSVLKNLRAQLDDELDQGGPDHLLAILREKNGARACLSAEEAQAGLESAS
jgi:ABC-type transporter MlaC component